MAPSRKKGASKSSAIAAAAACRRWKVGDLVLAKVKGFPAWPATVSEPEKWGYSTDSKKVLVYFFGTKQIAFCSPADVEAFTEEKKQSLLVKRQGKGADFIRALHEITDSFEKSKKDNKVDVVSSVDEVSLSKDNNGASFDANHAMKAQSDTPATVILRVNDFAKGRIEPSLLAEDAASAKEFDSLDSRETLSGKPTYHDNALATENLQPLTYSSKRRSKGTYLPNSAVLQKAPSARRSRSSSRIENCRLHTLVLETNNSNKTDMDVVVNSLQDGSLRRGRCSGKYTDFSDHHNLDALALVADVSADNVSEVGTLDSETCSLNEGSTIESGCKYDCSDLVTECLDENLGVSRELDLPVKQAVTRKRRQLTRKRVKNDSATHFSQIDEGVLPEVLVERCKNDSLNDFQNGIGSVSKDDGDKHLPLAKRARVRMSESLPSQEKPDACVLAGDMFNMDDPEITVGKPSLLLNCSDAILADTDAFLVTVGNNDALPPINCMSVTQHVPAFEDLKINQHHFGFMPDGESVLPPTKRLHRALEAMSANASKDGQVHSEAPTNVEVSSIMLECPNVTAECKSKSCIGIRDGESRLNDACQSGTSCSSPSLNPSILEVSTNCPLKVDTCNQFVIGSKDSDNQCKEVHVEVMNSIDNRYQLRLSPAVCSVKTIAEVQISEGHMENFKSNVLTDPLPLSNNQGSEVSLDLISTKTAKAGIPFKELSCLEPTLMGQDVTGAESTNNVSSDNESKKHLIADANDIKSSDFQLNKNGQVNNKSIDENEVEAKSSIKVVNSSLSPMFLKVRISSEQQSLSCLSDATVDHLEGKDAPRIPSNLSSTNRGSSVESALCSFSSEKKNVFQANGRCSPDIQKGKNFCKPDCEGKLELSATQTPKKIESKNNHSDAHVLLKSFQAILGVLTRTKENISRATCIAIDCAKCGVADEVVEILAHSLETESRLHKRVDLFFLVDSIIRSRGLKGNVGGVYPSTIQALLPRLLSAAAPPGSTALENRRQCHKVLKLWLDRRILPESVIRSHMRKLDSLNNSTSALPVSRRLLRTERSINDPVREMDGMLVDEYGSNSSFQLPGFCMPRMLRDEDDESDSDGGNFEAVTPEHDLETSDKKGTNLQSIMKKHKHILEDVDGELEMEDVAPSTTEEMKLIPHSGPSPPRDMPPSSPPLTDFPPPMAPPVLSPCPNLSDPPPIISPPSVVVPHPHAFTRGVDSQYYTGAHGRRGDYEESRRRPISKPPAESCSFLISHSSPKRRDYHLRPPRATPSNHFSYLREQMPPPQRYEPPFRPISRHHFCENMGMGMGMGMGGGGSFYWDEERLKSGHYERGDRCRFSASSFRGRVDPYAGQQSQESMRSLTFPLRGMSHRNFRPMNAPENGLPTEIRDPRYWRQ